MSDDDAFRRFLERATEDPIELDDGARPGIITMPGSRRRLVWALAAAAVVALAVVGLVRRDDGRNVSAGPIGPTPVPVLVLEAAQIPAGADDGTPVAPGVGPELRVEVSGAGSIEATDDGPRFEAGGQQRDDHAIVTLTGDDVAPLVSSEAGALTVRLVPLVGIDARTTPTGRNIVTFAEVTADETDDHLVLGVSLHLDPEIGPYLAGAIDATSYLHVLTFEEQARFSAGRAVELVLDWSDGVGTVSLDGEVLERITLDDAEPEWTDAARLAIGGSATFGGGYFTMHQDALVSVELLGLATSS